jgi:cytochrome b6-f complex iron-sulfur subunit
MSNYRVQPIDRPAALTTEAIKSLRKQQVQGFSRRQLLRTALGTGIGLWLLEVLAGTVAFAWPNLKGGFGSKVVVGDLETLAANPATQGTSVRDGAPAYLPEARAFVALVDPSAPIKPGESATGDGAETNLRTLYQRCTHLGCKPNFCDRNFWFECPCHGSRFDRLGEKVAHLGPAPRGLDRFAHTVDAHGVVTIDTGKLTLGPLPIALGQPGLIPPRTPTGCM